MGFLHARAPLWLTASALTLGTCGGATRPAETPAETAGNEAPPVERTPSSAAPEAVAVAPVPNTTSEEPAAAPPTKPCSEAPEVSVCEKQCEEGSAVACETLGDLFAKQETENEDLPGFTMGYVLRALGRACSLGAKSACDKSDAHLKAMRAACQKKAKDCSRLGRSLAGQEGWSAEADESLERACRAGDARACEDRGYLHQTVEPGETHWPIAERAFDRGCTLGDASACCALSGLYANADQWKKMKETMDRFDVANEKPQGGRMACDIFPSEFQRKARAIAKAEAASAKGLARAHVVALENALSRRIGSCYFEVPPLTAELEVDLLPNGSTELVGYSDEDRRRCVSSVVNTMQFAASRPAKQRVRFALSFEPER